jgi:hypothetical protein
MIAEGTVIRMDNRQDNNHAIGVLKADRAARRKGLAWKTGAPLIYDDPIGPKTFVSPM